MRLLLSVRQIDQTKRLINSRLTETTTTPPKIHIQGRKMSIEKALVSCGVPGEYLLKSKHPLLYGREVLIEVVVQRIHPDTKC